MNSDDEEYPFDQLLSAKKSPNISIPLDLSGLSKPAQFSLKDYHKLRLPNWPPNEVIDQSFTCISCNLQSSPRSTTPIISKIKFLDRVTGMPLTPRSAKQYVEYCCNDCVGGLKSTTNSPRFMEFAPSTPPSPRVNQEKAQRERIESRRSIERRGGGIRSSTELSFASSAGSLAAPAVPLSLDGSPKLSLDGSPKLVRSMSNSPAKIVHMDKMVENVGADNGGNNGVFGENINDFIRRVSSNDGTGSINNSPARRSNLSRSKTASDLKTVTELDHL